MKNKLIVLTLALGVMSQDMFAKFNWAKELETNMASAQAAQQAEDAYFAAMFQGIRDREAQAEAAKVEAARASRAKYNAAWEKQLQTFADDGGCSMRRVATSNKALMTERDAAIARISMSNASGTTLAPRIVLRKASVLYGDTKGVASFVLPAVTPVAPSVTLNAASFASKMASFMTPKTAAVIAGGSLATAGGVYAYNRYFNQPQPKPLSNMQKAQNAVQGAFNNSKSFVSTHKVATGSGIAVVAAGLGYVAYNKGWFKNPFGKAVKQTSKVQTKRA